MSMKTPMDKFIDGLGPAQSRFEQVTHELNMLNIDDSRIYAKGMQELQMHNWAAGLASGKRNGLLKKIMEEVK